MVQLVAKYQAGDVVRINGILHTLGSWPDDDAGPFLAFHEDNKGTTTQTTFWADQVVTDGEPVHTSATVELVEAGNGVESTASLEGVAADADDDEPEASLSEDADDTEDDAAA